MRKRELQSIPLKLAELQEYDMVKMVRALGTNAGKTPEEGSKGVTPIATSAVPKTKQEIHERINSTL